jgi:hypothetical protein
MSKNKPGGKRPGRKYRLLPDEGYGRVWHKKDKRPAKKELMAVLKREGINVPKRKKTWRDMLHPNRNWI